MKSKVTAHIVDSLNSFLDSDQLSTDTLVLDSHSIDKSFHIPHKPEVVIWPKNTSEVSNILKIANKNKIPVTPWGGGSSLEGNPIPMHGGIVLDFSQMNQLLDVMPEDLEARVHPGIIGTELDALLKPYGFWFASAPGSKHIATIGGMIANNAGGMYAVKYGVVKDAVLELEVVLANGDIIRVGSRSFKTVSGYDLKSLFMGSEGTLGIITEAVLKLTPLPLSKVAILVSFENANHAAHASFSLLKSSVKPASIEFMDKEYVGLINKAEGANLDLQPTLLIELHGDKDTNLAQLNKVKSICVKNYMTSFESFTTEKKLLQIWQYRRAVRPVLTKLLPNMGVLSAEVGVPVSRVPGLLNKAKEVSKIYGLKTIMFGHMGDGNFHGWALYELNNETSWDKAQKLNADLVLYAIKNGGTTTGEHGLGIGKRKYLQLEHPSTLSIMKAVKQLLDPNAILNPGKIFPDT